MNVHAKKLTKTKFMAGDIVTEEDAKIYFNLVKQKQEILDYNNPKLL